MTDSMRGATPWLRRKPDIRPLPTQPAPYGLAAGTRLAAGQGAVPVEELSPGDMIETTAGPQRLLRVLRQTVGLMLEGRQVELPAGLLGLAAPLVVSAGQRIVLRHDLARRHFATDAVQMTAGELADAGLASDLDPAAHRTLFLPVVLCASEAPLGPVALSLVSVEELMAQVSREVHTGVRPEISGAALRPLASPPCPSAQH